MRPFDPSELVSLADAMIEGVIDAASHARLQALLESSSEARRYYVQYMLMRADLVQMSGGVGLTQADDAAPSPWEAPEASHGRASLSDAVELPAIRPEDAADDLDDVSLPSPIYQDLKLPPRRQISRRVLLLAASLLIAATLVGVVLLSGKGGPSGLSHSKQNDPTPKPSTDKASMEFAPATLRSALAGVWSGSSINIGERLPQGWLTLESGLVEIQLDSGASLVIEAPARLRVQDNLLDLEWGRVAAAVPAGAHGFTVATEKCRVVDLGTEFGVEARRGESTGVAVFRGAITVAPLKTPAQETKLIAGEAVIASDAVVKRDPAGAVPQRFVRSLSSSATALDVVDLLSGGDGTTRRRGLSINPLTGKSGKLPAVDHQQSDKLYHRVAALPVIDGVFIPEGKEAVSSAGHSFAFPATTGRSYGHILVGGEPGKNKMAGVDYAAANHSSMLTHANAGLTIDLRAIRRLHPDRTLVRFRTQFGNDDTKPKDTGKIEVFILVDGQVKFARQMDRRAPPITIDIPLAAGDGFLTLAVTDGGDTISYDYMLWGDPTFDLQ